MATPILCDTHVLLWLLEGSPRLGTSALHAIRQAIASRECHFSSISIWEIAQLIQRKRLLVNRPGGAQAVYRQILRDGHREWSLTGDVGIEAEMLPDLHRDPADRFIVATALMQNAKLITADRRILTWSGPLLRLDAES